MSASDDLLPVYRGSHADVSFQKGIRRQFDKLDEKVQGGMTRIWENAANGKPLNEKQFKNEGKFPTGGNRSKNVTIYAIKDWQKRLYVADVDVAGRRTFVCCELDAAKKQDRADRDRLARAARNVRALVEEVGAKK